MNLYELIRTSIMEDINEHEIDGLIKTMKETLCSIRRLKRR